MGIFFLSFQERGGGDPRNIIVVKNLAETIFNANVCALFSDKFMAQNGERKKKISTRSFLDQFWVLIRN